ncbi:thiamine-phosphate diphosphorylase [Marivivens niveibacter]|uniref:Thiamine-phosphate synthase n=1 Tax=Marivivens niveibacter TaxID=1930667 RepID=A0A251WUX7_9RHOB|nr:thiamine phosphate synthase [Marivivens niveibacter]OUD08257.1 thiamine-phosphate diphosphorylase [Marivivens niveibacter]
MQRFYLITSSVEPLVQLVPLGVKLVQLRIKNASESDIRRQITVAKAICEKHTAQLVVNDHWGLAIELGCDFVHLGQEDMETADFNALRAAGIQFGLSTHDQTELDRAMSFDPAYIALGPIYETSLKKMKWAPQGLNRVAEWKTQIGQTPLVAIGGLTPERGAKVLQAGADSVAVVTDIQTAKNPAERTREWLKVCG